MEDPEAALGWQAVARLVDLGHLTEAEAAARALLSVPEVSTEGKYLLGVSLLAQGRYREGFPHYAARRKIPWITVNPPPPLFRRWAGEDLSGKRLLVWPEQGLGDCIMLARFAFDLGRRGVDVILMAYPELAALFAGRQGVSVMNLQESFSFSGIDFACTDYDLLAFSGFEPQTLPNQPYLAGSPDRLGRIGVMWRGSQKPNPDRSLSPSTAERLLSLPGAVSLQPEDTAATTMQQTADIIAGLDLVISVDTSVAHLAGAMGKPVWILLPDFAVDWRWGRKGTRTPWYPSATLFRQRPGQGWEPLIDDVISLVG